MLRYDLIKDEIFMGEPPPVLYIFGSTKEFHELAVSLLPFLKGDPYSLACKDIGLLFEPTIIMNNNSNNGIINSKNKREIFLELDRENWIDIIIKLVTLSLSSSHSYLEFGWLDKLGITVILESISGN